MHKVYKKIAIIFLIYYLVGFIFFSFMTHFWKEDGVWTMHWNSVGWEREVLAQPDFWLQIFIWPVFIACYFPENIICHA